MLPRLVRRLVRNLSSGRCSPGRRVVVWRLVWTVIDPTESVLTPLDPHWTQGYILFIGVSNARSGG